MLTKVAAYLAAAAVIQLFFSSFLFTGFCFVVVVLWTGGTDTLDILYQTLPRDLRAGWVLLKFNYLHRRNFTRNETVPRLFNEKLHLHPQKLALQQENQRWTYKMLDDYSNAYGNYFQKQGIKHGDCVSIFVDNRLEYVALWLGLAKIGATSALINFNLRKDALAHCINVSNSNTIVLLGSLKHAINEIRSELKEGIKLYQLSCADDGGDDDFVNIDHVKDSGVRMPPTTPAGVRYNDRLMYIYTSGTTGVPKAAVITHSRFYYLSTMSHLMLNYKQSDSIYCTLPLYHSNGGIVGVGQCLVHGIPVTIRSKFSASRFWTECKKYDCTVFLYIGEICRYLLKQPERDSDRDHRIRCGTGNGLRPEIWREFVSRFNVGKIAELYGATEGNANMMNITNVTGSCGFISVIAPSIYPLCLVKVDDDMNLVKDENNFCIKCPPGESGMLIGEIKQGNASREFEGYADKKATASKVCNNVFRTGDSYFLTGDVLVGDKYGNMYFKDRTGDTFRWKGENVSTAECEAELAKVLNNQFTVAVYGVSIPGADGKAGMAAIEDQHEEVNLQEFYMGAEKVLPSYARPLFVRLTSQVDMTGTHKLAKSKLRKAGYDMDQVSEPLYVVDNENKSYKRMTREIYEDIITGKIRM